ncbi:MAG: sulfatase [Planctomycetota bacterium]
MSAFYSPVSPGTPAGPPARGFRSAIAVVLALLPVVADFARADDALTRNTAAQTQPPNVLMIVSDDQAFGDYGFMGHPVIRTPHLDRLASQSAVFRAGYTPTALCRPSLMSMITGLYPHRHRVTGNDPRQLPGMTPERFAELRGQLIANVDSLSTIPRQLGQRGYVSMQTGKWWEGNYSRGGFTAGMTRGFPQPGGRHGDDGLEIGRKGLQPLLNFISSAAADRKPFFAWYAPMLPHTPHNPPPRLLEKYRTEGRPVELARYYAMVEWFDETCGALLQHLETTGLADQTLVVYVTDNGWIQATPQMQLSSAWTHGFAPRSKHSVYQGGIRTPILYRLPGRIRPADHPQLASTLDVMPTVLQVAGLDVPADLPGIGLLPFLSGQAELTRTTLCGEGYTHDVADLNDPSASLLTRWCISGPWKLILSWDTPPDRYEFVHAGNEKTPQLYNLEQDPEEQHNLAAQHPDIIIRLTQELARTWHVPRSPIAAE